MRFRNNSLSFVIILKICIFPDDVCVAVMRRVVPTILLLSNKNIISYNLRSKSTYGLSVRKLVQLQYNIINITANSKPARFLLEMYFVPFAFHDVSPRNSFLAYSFVPSPLFSAAGVLTVSFNNEHVLVKQQQMTIRFHCSQKTKRTACRKCPRYLTNSRLSENYLCTFIIGLESVDP